MAGIVRLGWSSASVAGLYRLENLLLGVLHVARRLLARGTSFQRVDAGGVRSSSRRWRCISSRRCDAFDAVDKRLVEDDVPEADRAPIIKNASGMIDEGTTPEAANFAQFEPIPSADGKWFGLRFVFPPYQVGPYSDGTQTVDVPASVLLPHVVPAYRGRFTGG